MQTSAPSPVERFEEGIPGMVPMVMVMELQPRGQHRGQRGQRAGGLGV